MCIFVISGTYNLSRRLDNFGFLLAGACIVFVVQFYVLPVIPRGKSEWGVKNQLPSQYEQFLLSGRGKTKVFRFDGKQLLRLYEFCTWTVHVDCMMLKTANGQTPIHIHDLNVDQQVSFQIKKYGTWESDNVQVLINELKRDPELGFMDLGSHIGTISLSVAKFGRKVVSVDPVIENVQRLCKSVQKGGFTENWSLIFNPMSDEHKTVNFLYDPKNVGGTYVVPAPKRNGTTSSCEESADSVTVTLDDLIPVTPFRKAVIKMDVERFEYRVIKGGDNFFKHVHVAAILHEWQHIKITPDGEKLLKILKQYGFKPYTPAIEAKELDFKNNMSWPYDVLWRRY